MRLLLDTCTFLWLVDDHPSLTARAREAIVDPANDVYLSAASAWEIVIKHALGRLELALAVDDYLPHQRELHGIESLPIGEQATLALAKLPARHRDPLSHGKSLETQAFYSDRFTDGSTGKTVESGLTQGHSHRPGAQNRRLSGRFPDGLVPVSLLGP